MMKYILYYLLPCKYAYKLLYDELHNDIRFIDGSISNGINCIVVTDISYDEYKKMDKATKLKYFDSYVKNNKVLNFIEINKISLIGIILMVVFGIISIL